MKYFVDFMTGAGNYYMDADSIEAVQKSADENASYTQASVVIRDDDGNALSVRRWIPVRYGADPDLPEEYDRIDFGDFGYLADWDDSDETIREF